jgi:hypothetical protein
MQMKDDLQGPPTKKIVQFFHQSRKDTLREGMLHCNPNDPDTDTDPRSGGDKEDRIRGPYQNDANHGRERVTNLMP